MDRYTNQGASESASQIPGITRKERSRFDEALAYFVEKRRAHAPGSVLRFRGVPVEDVVWTERDKIRVVLEYDKEITGIAARNGHATVFVPAAMQPTAALAVPPESIDVNTKG